MPSFYHRRPPPYITYLTFCAASERRSSSKLLTYSAIGDTPNPRRATAFEETKLIDKLCWRYECTHSITQMDNGCTPNSFAKPPAPPVTPPIGFKVHTSLTISAAGNLIPSDPIQNSQNILFETVADLLFNLAVLTGT